MYHHAGTINQDHHGDGTCDINIKSTWHVSCGLLVFLPYESECASMLSCTSVKRLSKLDRYGPRLLMTVHSYTLSQLQLANM